jgi:hypothetical protein
MGCQSNGPWETVIIRSEAWPGDDLNPEYSRLVTIWTNFFWLDSFLINPFRSHQWPQMMRIILDFLSGYVVLFFRVKVEWSFSETMHFVVESFFCKGNVRLKWSYDKWLDDCVEGARCWWLRCWFVMNWWTVIALIEELQWKHWQLPLDDLMNWCSTVVLVTRLLIGVCKFFPFDFGWGDLRICS